jgi:septum formation protein
MKKDFIYLASASPRRRELLDQVGVPYRVYPAEIDEVQLAREPPHDYVLRLARAKAEAVWQALPARQQRPVLAADTAVVLDGQVLGKPTDANAALEMLNALAGRCHEVLTGVTLRMAAGADSRLSRSEVRLRAMSPSERHSYCRGSEPLDKAGAYAIQGRAAVFIESLQGSYSGVMGLPLYETAALLAPLRLPGWLYAAHASA